MKKYVAFYHFYTLEYLKNSFHFKVDLNSFCKLFDKLYVIYTLIEKKNIFFRPF